MGPGQSEFKPPNPSHCCRARGAPRDPELPGHVASAPGPAPSHPRSLPLLPPGSSLPTLLHLSVFSPRPGRLHVHPSNPGTTRTPGTRSCFGCRPPLPWELGCLGGFPTSTGRPSTPAKLHSARPPCPTPCCSGLWALGSHGSDVDGVTTRVREVLPRSHLASCSVGHHFLRECLLNLFLLFIPIATLILHQSPDCFISCFSSRLPLPCLLP